MNKHEKQRRRTTEANLAYADYDLRLILKKLPEAFTQWEVFSDGGFPSNGVQERRSSSRPDPTGSQALRPDKIEQRRREVEQNIKQAQELLRHVADEINWLTAPTVLAEVPRGEHVKCANPNTCPQDAWADAGLAEAARCSTCLAYFRRHGKERPRLVRTVRVATHVKTRGMFGPV